MNVGYGGLPPERLAAVAQAALSAIIAVWAVGAVWAIAAITQVIAERRALARIVPGAGRRRPKDRPAEMTADALRTAAGRPGRSLVSCAISQLDAVPPGADHLTVVREIPRQRLEANADVPVFLANTLVLLGLAGTVIGLALSVGSIQAHLDATSTPDLGKLLAAMKTTLGYMRLAFLCTFGGIAGSLLLSALTLIYGRLMSGYLVSFDEALVTTLAPALTAWGAEAAAARITQAVEEAMESLRSAPGQLVEPLRAQMVEVAKAIQHSARGFSDGLAEAERSARAAVEGLDFVAVTFGRSVEGISGERARFEESCKELSVLLEAASQQQQRAAHDLHGNLAELRSICERMALAVGDAQQLAASGQLSVAQAADALASMHAALKDEVDRLSVGYTRQLGDTTTAIGQELRALRETRREVPERLETALTNLAQLASSWRVLSGELAQTMRETRVAIENLHAARTGQLMRELLDVLRSRLVDRVLPPASDPTEQLADGGGTSDGRVAEEAADPTSAGWDAEPADVTRPPVQMIAGLDPEPGPWQRLRKWLSGSGDPR